MKPYGQHIRDWGAFVFGVLGTVLGINNHYSSKHNTEITNQIQAERLIAEAWDKLGGKEGTTNIDNYVTAPDQVEIAARKIAEAQILAPRYAKAYWVEASVAIARKHYNQAASLCQKAIKLDPTSTVPYERLGQLSVFQGKWAEAANAYRSALRLNPQDPVSHSNLCFVLLKQNQLDAAVSACETAIQLEADFRQAYNNLLAVRKAQGRSADVIAVQARWDQLSAADGRIEP